MLTVGVDTFISVEDADKYVNDYYSDKSSFFDKWQALTQEQKEACLRRNTQRIDKLKYIGEKKELSQALSFPRVKYCRMSGRVNVPTVSQFYDNINPTIGSSYSKNDGMREAARATIINALYEVHYGNAIDDTENRVIKGITSKRIKDIAETYDNGYKMYNVQAGIYTQLVELELAGWRSGSCLSI